MKLFKYSAIAFCSCVLAGTGVAHAGGEVDVKEREPVGIGLTLGGGIVDFSDGDSNDLADLGGLWEVRAIMGLGSPVSLEAAYVGTAQSMSGPSDTTLLSNGAEGVVRLNLGSAMSQPYVFGGFGWKHFTLENGTRELNLPDNDDVYTIPVGAGFSFASEGFLFDIRGTYSFAFDDDLLNDVGALDDEASMNTWSATARVGVYF